MRIDTSSPDDAHSDRTRSPIRAVPTSPWPRAAIGERARSRADRSRIAEVVVSDRGRWQEPVDVPARTAGSARLRGLGLAMTGQLVDELEV